MNPIKSVDLSYQNNFCKLEINQAIESVLEKNDFILGEEVFKFEENFAKYIGTKYAVGVGNGTDALEIILEALDLRKDDEVIVPAYSYIASGSAVLRNFSKLKLVDIESNGTIDLTKLKNVINKKTKAIIVVHLYGNPANIIEISSLCKENNILIIEDCAQAHGSIVNNKKVGSFGLASAFSFFPGKNLGGFGDGGAILTNDDAIYEKVKRIRNHGRLSKFDHEILGRNSRLDTIQAAILNIKLKYFEQWIEKRTFNANIYEGSHELNKKYSIINSNIYGKSSYHQKVMLVMNRNNLIKYLKTKSISIGIHYPYALNQFKYFNQESNFEVARRFSEQAVSLPIGEHLTSSEIEYVINNLLNY